MISASYRKASVGDLQQIVSIHLDAFRDFFLSSLGQRFLSVYYMCFINCNDAVVLVVEDGNVIVGFSATALHSRGFNRRLVLRNLWYFFPPLLVLLFSKPRAIIRLIRNMSKTPSVLNNQDSDNQEYAELFSIGVLQSFQGKGLGKQLLKETEKHVADVGIERLSLTTDFDNNESALSFYGSMGYNVLYSFVTYPHRKMYRLIKNM